MNKTKYFGDRLRKRSSKMNEEYTSDLSSDSSDEEDGMDYSQDDIDEVIVTDHSKPLLATSTPKTPSKASRAIKKGIAQLQTTRERLTNRQIIMRRIRSLPRNTTIMSIVMFLLGIIFNTIAIVCLKKCSDRQFAIGWFVAGGVMICPGAYAVFIIW